MAIAPPHNQSSSRLLVPGPGTYDPNFSQIQEGVKNTRISPGRSSPKDHESSPGPGSYDYNSKNIGKDCIGYSMN